MTITLFLLVKLLASSALLYAFYWLVLRNKATYDLSRRYLLALPMVCIVMSVVTFDVSWPERTATKEPAEFTPPVAKVEQQTNVVPATSEAPAPIITETQTSAMTVAEVQPEPLAETPVAAYEIPQSIDTKNDVIDFYIDTETVMEWFTLLWVVVALILIIEALYQTITLKRKSHRMAAQTTREGYALIQSDEILSPCSFGRTIFLPSNVEEQEAATFIKHETAHIRHAHYVDVWAMEVWARLMWFNPVMWFIRHELRNIHEFQADHDVLSTGTDLNYYQVLLLDQVMEGSSIYANGFTHSFIRRRFVEMKRSTAGTLGKIGKFATLAWMGGLFCFFTFGACGKDESAKHREPQFHGIKAYDTPQPFILHGVLNRFVTDSCYLVYLSDEYMHITEDVPVDTIRVIDCELKHPWNLEKNKFIDTLYIDKICAGRIRGINADGSRSSIYADFFFVPNEEVSVYLKYDQKSRQIHNKEGWGTPNRWYQRAMKNVKLLRNANRMKSPHQPELVGTCWDHVESDVTDKSPSQLYIRQVCFGKSETVIRILPTYLNEEAIVSSNSYLVDDRGRMYQFKEALFGTVDMEMSPEAVTFGGLYAYEPLPDDVKYFSFYMGDKTTSAILNVHPVEKASRKRPNFTLDVNVTPGISDDGYVIYGYDVETGAEVDLGEHYEIYAHNRKCHERMRIEKPLWATMNATFPDGTVCPASIGFPFIPGERAEITVHNGTFDITGSRFYRQYSTAQSLVENARKYKNHAETDSICLDYLRQHANEDGCIVFFLTHYIIEQEELEKHIPASFREGPLRYFIEH